MEETKTSIKGYLMSHFRNPELRDDEDIFAAGFVNSMFAMKLVMYVEKEFGLKLANEDLDFDNFRSVDAMARLVHIKKG